MLFMIPRVDRQYEESWNPESWVILANVSESTVSEQYLQAIHITLCHFLNCGTGMYLINVSGIVINTCFQYMNLFYLLLY